MKKKENKKKNTIQIVSLVLAILIVLTIIGTLVYGYAKKATEKVQNPVATIEVEDYGTLKVELYPDMAPNTVSNFVALANNGFYDGLTFHRVIKDFMIQGGDPEGNGSGSPSISTIDTSVEKDSDKDYKYNINGEFVSNDYEKNTLKLTKGVIAMARNDYSSYAQFYGNSFLKEGYNSAGSQFFIMTTDDNVSLTGSYAGFGKVIEGEDVLAKIAATKVKKASKDATEASTPEKAPKIKSIKVETYGVDYGTPETHKAFDLDSYFSQQFATTSAQ